MLWTLVAYAMFIDAKGEIAIDPRKPIVVESNLTETDCSIYIEAYTDTEGNQFYFECQPNS